MDKREIGRMGETFAARKLESDGYVIVDRNWQVLEGEIDLVAEREGVLVFVEVRTRASKSLVSPEESFTQIKQKRVIRAALRYLKSHGLLEAQWRVDMVALEYSAGGKITRSDHYENVIQGSPEDFL